MLVISIGKLKNKFLIKFTPLKHLIHNDLALNNTTTKFTQFGKRRFIRPNSISTRSNARSTSKLI